MPYNIRNQTAYISTGDPETVNDPRPYAPGMLGARVTIKQPTVGTPISTGVGEQYRFKTFQYVQTDSTMTVAPFKGAVAWWSNKASYLVTTTVTTLGRGRIAGVFENDDTGRYAPGGLASPITLGNFCFIQTQGPGLVKFVDAPTAAPTAAGLLVIPSATNGKADCLAAGSSATYPILGLSASTFANIDGSNTLALVDLDIAETP